jgi:hypothetical protein
MTFEQFLAKELNPWTSTLPGLERRSVHLAAHPLIGSPCWLVKQTPKPP